MDSTNKGLTESSNCGGHPGKAALAVERRRPRLPRLERRQASTALALVEQPRFRAAFDFLRLRADAPAAFGEAAQLRIDGGMSKSAWFSQRLADLTGLSVRRASYQETTALGAALFAGVGAGLYGSIEEAAEASPAAETLASAMGEHAREAAYARWLDAVPRVRL